MSYSHIVDDTFSVQMIVDQCVYSPEFCDPEFAGLFNEIGYSLDFYVYSGRSTKERHEGILAFADDPWLDRPGQTPVQRP